LSTPAAGWLADHFGTRMAFFGLMGVGIMALLLVAFAMPETRPNRDSDEGGHSGGTGQADVNATATATDDSKSGPPSDGPAERRRA
jgi:predicted MFS family arabinose efflux permease